MLKKPTNYDEVEVNNDFTPIALGGHKGIIMSAEEYENPANGNTSLKVIVDTDKDDAQPSYFTEMYRNDERGHYENKTQKFCTHESRHFADHGGCVLFQNSKRIFHRRCQRYCSHCSGFCKSVFARNCAVPDLR